MINRRYNIKKKAATSQLIGLRDFVKYRTDKERIINVALPSLRTPSRKTGKRPSPSRNSWNSTNPNPATTLPTPTPTTTAEPSKASTDSNPSARRKTRRGKSTKTVNSKSSTEWPRASVTTKRPSRTTKYSKPQPKSTLAAKAANKLSPAKKPPKPRKRNASKRLQSTNVFSSKRRICDSFRPLWTFGNSKGKASRTSKRKSKDCTAKPSISTESSSKGLRKPSPQRVWTSNSTKAERPRYLRGSSAINRLRIGRCGKHCSRRRMHRRCLCRC